MQLHIFPRISIVNSPFDSKDGHIAKQAINSQMIQQDCKTHTKWLIIKRQWHNYTNRHISKTMGDSSVSHVRKLWVWEVFTGLEPRPYWDWVGGAWACVRVTGGQSGRLGQAPTGSQGPQSESWDPGLEYGVFTCKRALRGRLWQQRGKQKITLQLRNFYQIFWRWSRGPESIIKYL